MPAFHTSMSCAAPVVDISKLEFGWTRQSSLLSIDQFEIAAGELVFLTGPSGCGKSTLLGLIAGVLLPRSGTVRVAGASVAALAPGERDRLRGAHIGFIFQMFNLIPYLDIRANVLLPLHFSAARRQRLAHTTAELEVARLLDALGLASPELANRPVAQLSIGQQQRVAAARALIGRPELVIADEPTAALDAEARSDFLGLLIGECRANASAVLLVSHDRSIGTLFDRSVAMSDLSRAAHH